MTRLPAILIVCVSALFSVARPSLASGADPFAGDERMSAKRTIRIHDQPIPDFLADLNIQTGIRFFADKTVINDKITVYAHEKPLADTLRAVAGFFRFEWKRDGAAKDYGYTLAQSADYVSQQDRQRRERTGLVADVILAEVAAFDKYSPLTEDQLQARQSTLNKDLSESTDPAKKKPLQLESAVVAQLIARSDWRKVLNKFLKTFNREQMIDLMLAGVTDYAWPAVPGAKTIPDAVINEIRNNNDLSTFSSGPGSGRGGPGSGESNYVKIRFTSDYRREPVLRWQMTLGRRNIHGRRGMDFASSLPSTALMFPPIPRETPPQYDWKSDPQLTPNISFEVRPRAPNARSVIDQPIPRPTLGDGLAAIDKVTPMDFIADCFYSTRMRGMSHYNQPIGDALAQMSYATEHAWYKQDGFIQFRSLTFDIDRRVEPPSGPLSRWTQRALVDGLDVDDYAEMASLSDGSIGTLLQMAASGDFPDSLQPLNQARDHLKLWNGLSRAQKRKASSDGIFYKDLSRDLQLMMAQGAMEPESKINNAKFRVEVRQTKLWGIRTSGGGASLSGVGSKEEALGQFQRADPAIKAQDVKQVLYSNARFIYETQEYMIYQAYATLPPVWLEGKADSQ